MQRIIFTLFLLAFSGTAQTLNLSDLSNQDVIAGLKEALNKGTANAVTSLGKENGYFGNDKVKIPMPESMQKIEKAMRKVRLGKYADELILTMNRAAEAAVPEARTLFISAIKEMTVQDAKAILTGGDTSATDYFRTKTTPALSAKFLPIVQQATAKVGVAQKYNQLASKAARVGLVDKEQTNLENYITQQALAGLFVIIADEEKAIRAHPLQQGSKLISKVFGAYFK
jgi:Protein of unknown function (DUF4197)